MVRFFAQSDGRILLANEAGVLATIQRDGTYAPDAFLGHHSFGDELVLVPRVAAEVADRLLTTAADYLPHMADQLRGTHAILSSYIAHPLD
jgi:hypothetical protein